MVKDKLRGQKILDLYLQGYSREAIQDILEISQSLISHHLTKMGYRTKSKPILNEQVGEMVYFLENGFTVSQIAEILDLSKVTVRTKLRQRGYDFNDKVSAVERLYIQSLWAKGYTINKIMMETGRARQTVKTHIAK